MCLRRNRVKSVMAIAVSAVVVQLVIGLCSTAAVAEYGPEIRWPDHGRATISARVVRVADGDTIVVDTGRPPGRGTYHLVDGVPIYRYERVRFVGGLNAPELWGADGKPEDYSYEAKWANWRLLAGREVRLEFRVERPRDDFGRLLAYVYVEHAGEWIMVNAELIRRGMGKLDPRFHLPEDRYYEYLWQMQIEALVARRGIWGRFPGVLVMDDLIADPVKYMGEAVTLRFVITETRDVRRRHPGLHIHGESPRAFNFRLFIPEKRLPGFEQAGMDRDFWTQGKEITVTGVVAWDRGVVISLESPLQIRENAGDKPRAAIADERDETVDPFLPVHFADPNLESVVREIVDRPTAPILRKDLGGITSLSATGRDITDLGGIEHLVDLRVLTLCRNQVRDLTPLSSLTQLEELSLGRNQISDLAPLSTLTRLRRLDLGVNRIYDITPLSELAWLNELSLQRNQISDLTPLAGLTRLRRLVLTANCITDIAPLAGLDRLELLYLAENLIRDVTALAGLVRLQRLDLNDNEIRIITPLARLGELDRLQLVGNQISDISPLRGLGELRTLHLCRNPLTTIAPLAELVWLQELLLGWTGISDITPLATLTELQRLALGGNEVSDITPLAGLVELAQLWLYWNRIEDVAALANLRRLEQLALRSNRVKEIEPLALLIRLEWLCLGMNRVEDIGPLAGLTKIREISLSFNQITDLAPLVANSGLAEGDTVFLGGNPLDLTPGSPAEMASQELRRRGVSVR